MRFLLFFLLFSIPTFAQENDSLKGPSNGIIDSAYLSRYMPWCTYDSTAKLRPNTTFAIADSNFLTYSFQQGTKTYLEVTLQTLKCRASDSDYSDQLIIDISSIPDSGAMTLSPENVVWITWGSWSRPKTETFIDGTLTLQGGRVSLKAFAYYDSLYRAVRNDIQLDMPVD